MIRWNVIRAVALSAGIGCLWPAPAPSMLLRSVVGNGGLVSTGTRTVVGTVGQAAIGRSQNPGMVVHHGFWKGGILGIAAVEAPGGALDLPRTLAFGAPAPNPSQGRVQFDVAMPVAGWVRLTIVDASGRAVASVRDGRASAGRHRIAWNGRDAQGTRVAAGVYFARLTVDGQMAGPRTLVVVP